MPSSRRQSFAAHVHHGSRRPSFIPPDLSNAVSHSPVPSVSESESGKKAMQALQALAQTHAEDDAKRVEWRERIEGEVNTLSTELAAIKDLLFNAAAQRTTGEMPSKLLDYKSSHAMEHRLDDETV
eukprot:gnl/MRDRNA2_/MRDRNA2_335816_c0_seq1.p1 gnl/MRDRNA2_/MRDRNA2_335816_c0~~gnl/MRDRNA2_/MRDRNA2_335816_c0_seq1.p1  ORF type:complete len:133 (-),score=26.62 gnl/MRDRNA2_/MRDRNA2_335816_c0_seq1:83-460(-)